jgi:galactokinase
MDQTIALLGKPGHALLIDCRLLKTTPVPIALHDYAIVVCDTRVKHSLASSEYNTRRAECERGVELLRQWLPDIRALRDVSPSTYLELETRLPEPIRRRCRHVITENARTCDAAEALRAGDAKWMGRLMAESHRSLRDCYEVSCRELDVLVEIATSVEGVAGARMTGGGFGGSTVNLVRRDVVGGFCDHVAEGYNRAVGIEPAIYVSEASGGASEIDPTAGDLS